MFFKYEIPELESCSHIPFVKAAPDYNWRASPFGRCYRRYRAATFILFDSSDQHRQAFGIYRLTSLIPSSTLGEQRYKSISYLASPIFQK